VRDKVGSSMGSAGEVQRWLTKWVKQYEHGNPTHASEIEKAKKPLAASEVIVDEIEGSPGYYKAQFLLKPHYQLEGLTVALKLVSRLKSEKK
jgi:type VI secretion system protein ImpC